jgi:hypothetical protein
MTCKIRRTAVRTAAGAAMPVLLVAGCSAISGNEAGDSGSVPSPSTSTSSATPSPAPVKFAELPDACDTVSKDTIGDVVPEAKPKGGKNLGSEDVDTYTSCLWTGLDDFDYRALTVSLRRFDSDTTIGSGAERAAEYAEQQLAKVSQEKDNKDLKDSRLSGLGDSAAALGYEVAKKEGKSSEDYREQRVVVRSGNVVITVDYSGAGFEDAKTPSAGDIGKGAEKTAKEVTAALG